MMRLEPSTALTPTSNWRLGFQSVDGRGSSIKPAACFNVARPAEKTGSGVGGESLVAALVQRITVREARIRMRCVRRNDFMSGQPLLRVVDGHKTRGEE